MILQATWVARKAVQRQAGPRSALGGGQARCGSCRPSQPAQQLFGTAPAPLSPGASSRGARGAGGGDEEQGHSKGVLQELECPGHDPTGGRNGDLGRTRAPGAHVVPARPRCLHRTSLSRLQPFPALVHGCPISISALGRAAELLAARHSRWPAIGALSAVALAHRALQIVHRLGQQAQGRPAAAATTGGAHVGPGVPVARRRLGR